MPEHDAAPTPGRPGGTVRGLLASVLGLISAHVETVGIELLEEKERLQQAAVLGAVAAVGLGLALLMVSALLVAAFWETYRLLVIGLLAAVYFVAGAWALMAFRARLVRHPNPFATTVAELHKDRERLHHP